MPSDTTATVTVKVETMDVSTQVVRVDVEDVDRGADKATFVLDDPGSTTSDVLRPGAIVRIELGWETEYALALLGIAHGFAVETVGAVSLDGVPVSSSRIRDLLKAGDPRGAAKLLTRPFTVAGTVQHGDKLGRTIGYPTANLDMGKYLRPAYGIYAVRGRLADGRVLDGAANLGIRPSFDPPKELLEPYFFDFSEDLYGQPIEVELIAYLRPEAKFDSLEALTEQMDADCARAREILANEPR